MTRPNVVLSCVRVGSRRGVEQLFDLVEDPGELRNVVASRPELRALWRDRLIESLKGREEGFVADGNLVTGRPVTPILKHARERIAAAAV
jgi:arylsulfatase